LQKHTQTLKPKPDPLVIVLATVNSIHHFVLAQQEFIEVCVVMIKD